MKRIVCEDCLNRELRQHKSKTGEVVIWNVCNICKKETKRLKECPLGFTEEIIIEIYRKGEMADKERYFKESMKTHDTDSLMNLIKELAL